MKKIFIILIAVAAFLSVAGGAALADQTVCQGSYANCNAACTAAGGTCFDRSCSWSGSCPTGGVSQWCVAQFGRSLCGDSGTSIAFCKCTSPAPRTCVPTACAILGKNCGSWSDGCGGTLNCGSCKSGTCSNGVCITQTCAADVMQCPDGSFVGRNPSAGCTFYPCSIPVCVPKKSCSAGKNCGTEDNGCGKTVNCGSCSGGQVCYGSPSGTCASPHWTLTGTDLSVCAPRECYDPSCDSSNGNCLYSPSAAGTSCSGGKCYSGSCDKWPPSTSISLSPPAPNGANGWYVSSIAVSIACSDVGSGCDRIYYSTNGGGSWSSAGGSSTGFNLGEGTYGLKAYSTDKAGNAGGTTPLYSINTDTSAPSISIAGAPSNWKMGTATASASCSDSTSGCTSGTPKLYISSSASCPSNYASYTLPSPQAVSSHAYVCGAAKDNAGNIGFSSPVEFKVDNTPPSVSVVAAPFPPCTLDATQGWIDCSATASAGCADSDSGCNPSAYGYIIYGANPGTCPSSKSSYSSGTATVTSDKWGCAYAEDNAGNTAVSSPTEIKVNKTFTIIVSAKAYGDIDVPAGTEVKAYLCEPSQYYCNQDAAYLTSGSAVVGADKNFRITLVQVLERGQNYKVGIATTKGYAETWFTA